MNTVMITGCSSGFGRATAAHFLDQGWSVVATMRTPRENVLPASDRLRLLPLDVTEQDSIADAVAAAFGVGFVVIIGFLKIVSTYSYMPFVIYRLVLAAFVVYGIWAGLLDPLGAAAAQPTP